MNAASRHSRHAITGLVALSLLLAMPPVIAVAADYTGRGDTGWTHDNKRDCCEDAVALAEDDSAGLCEMAGGVPRFRSGSRRGLCDWDARGDVGDTIYRCTATATVPCR